MKSLWEELARMGQLIPAADTTTEGGTLMQDPIPGRIRRDHILPVQVRTVAVLRTLRAEVVEGALRRVPAQAPAALARRVPAVLVAARVVALSEY